MNKANFTELVKISGDYKTKVEAERAIQAFTTAIKSALSAQKNVSMVGFGSFDTALQKGKSGKVPGTNKSYKTQDKMVPKFKFSKAIKDLVEQAK